MRSNYKANEAQGRQALTGDWAPNTRVTVQKDWKLHPTGKNFGSSNMGPYRWFQKKDNSQSELDVPNIASVSIDRSIEDFAGQCNIEMYNNNMHWGDYQYLPFQVGEPGYYTYDHGNSAHGENQWEHVRNAWFDVLTPNALLRTYQGYGGLEKSTAQAVTDGDLQITGVWLIDSVSITAQGMISIKCRDIGKLLIEQKCLPPLVSASNYPLKFYRYKYDAVDTSFRNTGPELYAINSQEKLQFRDSTSYRWGMTPNTSSSGSRIEGHWDSHSIDGSVERFAMSRGVDNPNSSWAYDFWEYTALGVPDINQVYVDLWGGGYEVYISIYEGSGWAGNYSKKIPYSNAGNPESGSVNTGADIPYVKKVALNWEGGEWITLPRYYKAHRVRVTPGKPKKDNALSVRKYRSGLRQVKARASRLAMEPNPIPWQVDLTYNPVQSGFWALNHRGGVVALGHARTYSASTKAMNLGHRAVAICSTSTGKGYWVLYGNGQISSHGDAVHHGNAWSDDDGGYMDFARTPDNGGLWVLHGSGTVHELGNAPDLGDISSSQPSGRKGTAITGHPSVVGFWACDGAGYVTARGSGVPNYGGLDGSLVPLEWVVDIESNPDGTEYLLTGGVGSRAFNAGGSTYFPNNAAMFTNFTQDQNGFKSLTWGAAYDVEQPGGFWVIHADGEMDAFNGASWYGTPGGEGIRRSDGNYRDYSDIVRYLVAISGFTLYETNYPSNKKVPIFGNIENTGAHGGGQDLSEEFFDKKSIIDIINEIKEIVGFITYIDEAGGFHFESPNWWESGNFSESGAANEYIPVIHENTNLLDREITFDSEHLRSEIIIGTEFPYKDNTSTITTRVVPPGSEYLRGMVNPAIWINGLFINEREQRIMAELIALHIWFQQKVGTVRFPANPNIGINDQIRCFEKYTADTYIHYVRGYSSKHDLESGEFVYDVETNWLGNAENWVITSDNVYSGGRFPLSQLVQGYVGNLTKRPRTPTYRPSGRNQIITPGR